MQVIKNLIIINTRCMGSAYLNRIGSSLAPICLKSTPEICFPSTSNRLNLFRCNEFWRIYAIHMTHCALHTNIFSKDHSIIVCPQM